MFMEPLRGLADTAKNAYASVRQLAAADFLFIGVALSVCCLLIYIALGNTVSPRVVLVVATLTLAGMLVYLQVNLHREKLVCFFREAIEKTPSAFALYDEKDRLIARNEAYEAVHADSFEKLREPIYYVDLVRTTLAGTMPEPEMRAELAIRLRNHREATGKPTDRLYPNGRWLRVQKARTASGANVGVAIDVTELHEATAAAERERARFRGLAETLPIGLWHFDAEGRTIFVNRRLLELFGLADERSLAGLDARDFISAHVAGYDRSAIASADDDLGNLTIAGEDGSLRHVIIRTSELQAGVGETIMSFIDVTPLKEAERRIDYLAHRDTLTGARNRAAFGDAVETAARLATPANPCWVMAMDLDGFKPVNDQYGHAAGDLLLKQLVQRIDAVRPENSFLFRLGGDEFCLLIMGLPYAGARRAADAILSEAAEPFDVQSTHVRVCISIGVAEMPRDAVDAETAQRYADLALYAVKERGGGHCAFFTRELAERDLDERIMTLDIGRALADQEFELALQPMFSSRDRSILGAEALLRWHNRRTTSDVAPSDFIQVAERRGLIARIDLWVIATVGARLVEWAAAGLDVPPIMVNTSPITLDDPEFVHAIDALVARYPALRHNLVIEVTEGVAIRNEQRLRATFAALRARGIGTAVDDFGVGQTSVALLRDLPVDFIKIDRSYVATIDSDPQTLAIFRTFIRLGEELGVRVVAEGVETEAQLDALREAGCDIVQGYLWAMPGSVDAFATLLAGARAEPVSV